MAGSSGFFCSGTSTLQSLPEGEQEIELEESEKDHGSGKLLHRSDPVEMVLWGWDQVCTLYQETLVPVVSCFFPCWYSCFGCPHQSQHQECVEVGITVTDSPMVDLAQSWPSWGMTPNLAEKQSHYRQHLYDIGAVDKDLFALFLCYIHQLHRESCSRSEIFPQTLILPIWKSNRRLCLGYLHGLYQSHLLPVQKVISCVRIPWDSVE